MSRDMNLLTPEFHAKVNTLLINCEKQGVVMVPFFTVRDPLTQAKLWRQSRSTALIRAKINHIKENGAPFLAACIEKAGPQHGRWATNAIPGLSWHQYGEAVDCYAKIDTDGDGEKDDAAWDAHRREYAVYAMEASNLGLEPGYYWTTRDAVHVQLRKGSVMERFRSLQSIDAEMQKKFNHLI